MKQPIRAALAAIALSAAALGAAALGAAMTASAHAEFDHSSPVPMSTVATSPGTVDITFVEEIQVLPGSYGIDVTDATGASVTAGSATVSTDKRSLSVALQPNLANGTYTVAWTNTSADDGDPANGRFTFNVGSATVPPDGPTIMPAPSHSHGHDDGDASAAHDAVAPPTTGLISAPVVALNDSGITGRIDVFPVDGGMRSRIDVILSGMAPDSTHVSHVHGSATCFEGSHVADLNAVTANDAGTGSASTTIDVAFSALANGKNNILWHTNATADNPGPPIACGVVPAQPATALAGIMPVSLPETGAGPVAGHPRAGWLALMFAALGLSAVTLGAMMPMRVRR